MSGLPEKIYVKRGEVRDYLGLTELAITKLIRAGALLPKYFPGMKRAVFEREAVLKLKPAELERNGERSQASRVQLKPKRKGTR